MAINLSLSHIVHGLKSAKYKKFIYLNLSPTIETYILFVYEMIQCHPMCFSG